MGTLATSFIRIRSILVIRCFKFPVHSFQPPCHVWFWCLLCLCSMCSLPFGVPRNVFFLITRQGVVGNVLLDFLTEVFFLPKDLKLFLTFYLGQQDRSLASYCGTIDCRLVKCLLKIQRVRQGFRNRGLTKLAAHAQNKPSVSWS